MSSPAKKLRRPGSARGFTLIELLIVVAIISIMSAASLSIMTAPAAEQVRATADSNFEAGCSTFFSRIATEAHNATDVTFDSGKLVFSGSRPVTYYVDAGKQLRRVSDLLAEQTGAPAGAALLENVEQLTSERIGDSSMRIGVRCLVRSPGESKTVSREMIVSIGTAWIGRQ